MALCAKNLFISNFSDITNFILFLSALLGFFLRSFLSVFLEEVKLPIQGYSDLKNLLNLPLHSNSSDGGDSSKKNSSDNESGPPAKKARKDSSDPEAGPSNKKANNKDLFGFDIRILDKDGLKSSCQQLRQALNEPSSSKDDKSELEEKLKALEKEISSRHTEEEEFFKEGLGPLDKASDSQIKEVQKKLYERLSSLDQDSEEYYRLQALDEEIEEEFARRMEISNSNSPEPEPRPSGSNVSEDPQGSSVSNESNSRASESNHQSKDKGKGKLIEGKK